MQLKDSEQVVLNITAKDAAGNDAPVQAGSVIVTPSDPSLLQIVPGVDETHPIVQSVGALGSANVHVAADADLGDGVTTIEGDSETVDVIASQATSLGIGFGTPEAKP